MQLALDTIGLKERKALERFMGGTLPRGLSLILGLGRCLVRPRLRVPSTSRCGLPLAAAPAIRRGCGSR